MDYPPKYSYKVDHTTFFKVGNPTYLGQLYDVTLGSPLLMALAPSSTPHDRSSHNAEYSSPNPNGLLAASSPDETDNAFKFPTRIFYRSRKSQHGSHEDQGSLSAWPEPWRPRGWSTSRDSGGRGGGVRHHYELLFVSEYMPPWLVFNLFAP